MKEKQENKKGISFVGLIFVLVLLVVVEGFYIVKLRGDETNDIASENKNVKIASNVENKKVDEPKKDDENQISETSELTSNETEANATEIKKEEVNTPVPTEEVATEKKEENPSNDTKNTDKSKKSNLEIVEYLGYDIKPFYSEILNQMQQGIDMSALKHIGDNEVVTKDAFDAEKNDYETKISNALNNPGTIIFITIEGDNLKLEYNLSAIFQACGVFVDDYSIFGLNEKNTKEFIL